MSSITDPDWEPEQDDTCYTWSVTYQGFTYTLEEQAHNLLELWENAEIGYVELFEMMGIDYPEDDESLYDEVEMSCQEETYG